MLTEADKNDLRLLIQGKYKSCSSTEFITLLHNAAQALISNKKQTENELTVIYNDPQNRKPTL